MLILGRKQGESIHVGDNITLTVIKINRNFIHLGIQAPPDVVILREELMPYNNAHTDKNLNIKDSFNENIYE